MPDSDDATAGAPPDRASAETDADSTRAAVRSIAHSLNGALNTLALNVELLDRATMQRVGSDEDEVNRTRYVASLRRAIREIQKIVELQLSPLGRKGGPHASA